MRNNTYIHIRREANSLMTEQKFPCEGIGISLRGNWNFLARGFMRHAAGLRALGFMLVLMGLENNTENAPVSKKTESGGGKFFNFFNKIIKDFF